MSEEPLRAVTADEIAAFERDGVVCLRGVLPRDWLARMEAPVEAARLGARSADMTEMARAIERSGGSVLEDVGAARTAASGERGRFFGGTDHWRDDPDFRAFAVESPLPALAAALLRSREVFLYEDSVLVKEPGTVEPTAFHQDAGYFHVSGEKLCTFWCPLDPVGPETGAVVFVKGSHGSGRVYRPNLFVSEQAIPGTEGEDAPQDFEGPDLLTFSLEPGDLTVHHARTLHGAPGNRSPSRRRRAISVRYCGDDARHHLRPGAPRKPHHDDVAEGSPLGGPHCPRVWP